MDGGGTQREAVGPWRPPGWSAETGDKTLALLSAIAASPEPMTAAEVAREVGRHRGSVYRDLDLLASEGWLRATGSPKRYAVSWRLTSLGTFPLRRNRAREVAITHAMQLALRTGELVLLGFWEQGWAYCSDAIHVAEGMAVPSPVGSAIPGISSGGGRVLLAFAPEEEQERVARMEFPRFTSQTITGYNAVLAELAATRERGYALVFDDLEAGRREVTFPVFDHDGQAVVALGMLFKGGAPDPGTLDLLRQHAAAASSQLGFRSPSPSIGI